MKILCSRTFCCSCWKVSCLLAEEVLGSAELCRAPGIYNSCESRHVALSRPCWLLCTASKASLAQPAFTGARWPAPRPLTLRHWGGWDALPLGVLCVPCHLVSFVVSSLDLWF